MNLRPVVHEWIARHALAPAPARQLVQLAGLEAEPSGLARALPRGVAVAGAALIGLGGVLWVAANWDDFGRFGRFALLQAVGLAAGAGAMARPAWRAPLGLAALLFIGALFAYFGQTYQTGADPWSLFALWAALALPLALGVRSDVVWAPWALVAMAAVSLWTHAHTGHRWRVEPGDLGAYAIAFAAVLAVVALLGRGAARVTGAGAWSLRTAATLAVVMVTLTALGGLFASTVAPHYLLGVLVLAGAAAAFSRRAAFDVFVLSALALGLVSLLVAGAGRLLLDAGGRDPLGPLLLLGLVAMGLLAAAVSGILRLSRAHGDAPAVGPEVAPAVGDAVAALRRRAIAAGLLPATADEPAPEQRPWPVVLLTALGAWLAALPLIGVVGLLLGGVLQHAAGALSVGVMLLALVAVLLRRPGLPLFVEQLVVPLLLVGAGSLAIGFAQVLPGRLAAATLAGVALAMALALERPWLRVLLGAAAACCAGFALTAHADVWTPRSSGTRLGATLHLLLLAGAAGWALQRFGLEHGRAARVAAALESTLTGWTLAVLAGLCALAGMSFLVGAMLPSDAARMVEPRGEGGAALVPFIARHAVSAALALAAAVAAARAWPALRAPALWGVMAVAVLLAAAMPELGAALLVASLAIVTRRVGLAAAAAVAAAWVIGAFYYRLTWPLAHKALLLVAAGALLAAMALWLRRATLPAAAAAPTPRPPLRWAIGASALATLAVANGAIWQKEDVIAHGAPLFVELAPVDPRSLMQGDFMRLGFRVPEAAASSELAPVGAARPHVVARRDARGVATLERLHLPGQPLAEGELLVELTPQAGRWILVTDAWFFREGEGARWSKARYGEFRVAPGGQALLVGLADAQLQPIRP